MASSVPPPPPSFSWPASERRTRPGRGHSHYGTTTLSGIVRDDGGRLLEGAEILVLAQAGRADGAALRAVTDAGGRFVVGSITPGVYRVAAIKTGYIAATGQREHDAPLLDRPRAATRAATGASPESRSVLEDCPGRFGCPSEAS